MQQQHCEAIFENGVLRPLTNIQLSVSEGQSVKLIIQSTASSRRKSFSKTGIIAELTANPIKIENFQPLTREESNERC